MTPDNAHAPGGRQEQDSYLVTAVVSTYASQAFIEGCLQDLVDQTLYAQGKLEIVVIDSASPEDEQTIVQRFMRDHPHIVYERTPQRETLYAAWNRGVAKARGRYVSNANTDDRHRLDALEILAAALENNPDAGVAYGDCLVTERPNETWARNSAASAYAFPRCSLRQALSRQFFGPQPLWRVSAHRELGGFDPGFTVQGDYDFFIRMVRRFGGVHVPKALGIYCRRQDSVERANRDKNVREQARVKALYRSDVTVDEAYPALGLYAADPLARLACHLDLGNLFIKSGGDTASARVQYRLAGEIMPEHPAPQHNLALCGLLEKQHQAAGLPAEGTKPVPREVLEALAAMPHDVVSCMPPVRTGSLEFALAEAEALRREERAEAPRQRTFQAACALSEAMGRMAEGDFETAEAAIVRYRANMRYDDLPRNDKRPATAPRVSVVIPAFRTGQALLDCVESLGGQSSDNFEIIVVDNGGNEAVTQALLALPLLLIKPPVNLFPSEARNVGAHFARGKVLAFVDDDGLAHSDFVGSVERAFDAWDIKALRGRVRPRTEDPAPGSNLAPHYDLGPLPMAHYVGVEGCSAFDRRAYMEAGGMEPLLFGAEGLETAFKISQRHGLESVIYWPETILFHDYADTGSKLQTKTGRHARMHEFLKARRPGVLQYLHHVRALAGTSPAPPRPVAQDQGGCARELLERLQRVGWEDRMPRYSRHLVSITRHPRETAPAVSVVVIANDPGRLSLETFALLQEQRDQRLQLVFVDNGSHNEFAQRMERLSDVAARLGTDTGAYLARNIGACLADAPVLLFLDDDARPAPDFVQSHLMELERLGATTLRGVVRPRTDSPLNSVAGHYHLGETPFPRFPDLEGNMSIRAEAFFAVGGWDDAIRFGHGGIELSRRLLHRDPDKSHQMYSPRPVVLHEYAKSQEHLTRKRTLQRRTWEYLRRKHPDIDAFLASWEAHKPGATRAPAQEKDMDRSTLSRHLKNVLDQLQEGLRTYPRRTPGELELNGVRLRFADLHSFYFQGKQIFFDKYYEFETDAPSPLILDCGAHIGMSALYFATRYPGAVVQAYEADPAIAAMLADNVRAFGLGNVTPYHAAVWTHDQGVNFASCGDDSGAVSQDADGRVPSVRLRDILAERTVDLLKMDIEGAEFEVLEDCADVLRQVKRAVIEVHCLELSQRLGRILNLLEDSGFTCCLQDLIFVNWTEKKQPAPFSHLKDRRQILNVYAWQTNSPHGHVREG
ncbi:FkbM family methyltransferase [Desulfocurvus sp. DL9XJH121]